MLENFGNKKKSNDKKKRRKHKNQKKIKMEGIYPLEVLAYLRPKIGQ